MTNPFRYAGYYYDSSTGLYDLWHRYYDSELARFLTLDSAYGSLDTPATLNPYVYVVDNPLTFTDSSGETLELPPGVFSPTYGGPFGPPPPVKVPGGGDYNGWRWNPDGQNTREGTWGLRVRVRRPIGENQGGQPSASWEPGTGGLDGHWDVHDGLGNRQRYDRNGRPISSEDAHDGPNQQSACPTQDNNPTANAFQHLLSSLADWLRGFGGSGSRSTFPLTP